MTAGQDSDRTVVNGAALAAFLGAAIGAFAMGLLVILNEAGVFSAPPLYAPAGGVTGRTTLAAVTWLIAWTVLHKRWKGRQLEARLVHTLTMILIGLSVLLTFPPVWRVF